jgi:hypothetical protein
MDFEFETTRTALANAFAAAGGELLDYMGNTDTDAVPIPDTQPQKYAVAGTLKGILSMAGKMMGEDGVTGLEGLTRYEPISQYEMGEDLQGDYVKFADVERLLAAPTAVSQPTGDLPPLPITCHVVRNGHGDIAFYAYAPEEMQAYARAAIAAHLERQAQAAPTAPKQAQMAPVAYLIRDNIGNHGWSKWEPCSIEEHELRKAHTDIFEFQPLFLSTATQAAPSAAAPAPASQEGAHLARQPKAEHAMPEKLRNFMTNLANLRPEVYSPDGLLAVTRAFCNAAADLLVAPAAQEGAHLARQAQDDDGLFSKEWKDGYSEGFEAAKKLLATVAPAGAQNALHKAVPEGCYLSWDGKNVYGDNASILAVKNALHDAGTVPELKGRICEMQQKVGAQNAVPHEVRRALKRMCTPLHESRLSAATADEDARCMQIIKQYIEAGAHNAEAIRNQWISVDERLPEKYCLAVYRTHRGMQRVIRAMHVKKYEIEASGDECDTDYNEGDDTEYIKPGWYECIDNCGEYSSVAVCEGFVTHWMPLPAVPEINTSTCAERSGN